MEEVILHRVVVVVVVVVDPEEVVVVDLEPDSRFWPFAKLNNSLSWQLI